MVTKSDPKRVHEEPRKHPKISRAVSVSPGLCQTLWVPAIGSPYFRNSPRLYRTQLFLPDPGLVLFLSTEGSSRSVTCQVYASSHSHEVGLAIPRDSCGRLRRSSLS